MSNIESIFFSDKTNNNRFFSYKTEHTVYKILLQNGTAFANKNVNMMEITYTETDITQYLLCSFYHWKDNWNTGIDMDFSSSPWLDFESLAGWYLKFYPEQQQFAST